MQLPLLCPCSVSGLRKIVRNSFVFEAIQQLLSVQPGHHAAISQFVRNLECVTIKRGAEIRNFSKSC